MPGGGGFGSKHPLTFFAIWQTEFPIASLGEASGNIGLAVTQIFSLITMCQWGMRQTSELENQMTSVERVVEYTKLETEPPLESDEKQKPDSSWPKDGAINFEGLSLRYSVNDCLVLKDVNLQILPGEKIGIVGRTGAGKSSIIQALFRLAHNEGLIVVDGVDIATLGLHELRQKISIIPQDPILFSGTMRDNLDPFNQKTDDELWRALALVSYAMLMWINFIKIICCFFLSRPI